MIMPDLLFTVTVKSELTGKVGTKTVKMDPNPDGMLERLHEAVNDCLAQIAGIIPEDPEEPPLPD